MNKKGFTLVELLLATTFFNFVLLFVIFGFIQINRVYNRGNTVKLVQDSSRTLFEQIVRDLRQSEVDSIRIQDPPGASYSSSNRFRLCLSGIRYGWNEHLGLPAPNDQDFSNEGFRRSVILRTPDNAPLPDCNNTLVGDLASTTFPEDLIIHDLDVLCTSGDDPCTSKTFRVSLVTSTKATDLLETFGENASCKITVNDEFCDVVRFESAVTVRN